MRIEKVQAGLAKFIDRDVVPSLNGWDRVLVGAGGGLLAARLPELMRQYAGHPIVSALGVCDADSGEVDVDALYNAALPYVAEPLPIKIPFVGITIKVSQRELETLYAYINES